MKTLYLKNIFNSPILRSRSAAQLLFRKIQALPSTEKIILDFEDIDFVSRSFANELLVSLRNRANVSIVNTNSNIEEMFKVAKKKPKVHFEGVLEQPLLA